MLLVKNNLQNFSMLGKILLKSLWNKKFPNSMGSFYSTFTSFLGFKPQSDEWKLMGASAYGNSKRFEKKIKKIIYPTDDGFELDLSYFNHSNFIGLDTIQKSYLII